MPIAIAVVYRVLDSKAIYPSLIAAGWVPFLVKQMKGASESMQSAGAFILQQLAIEPAHREAIIGAGVVGPLIDIIENASVKQTQRNAVGALAFLASRHAYFLETDKNRAIPALMRLIKGNFQMDVSDPDDARPTEQAVEYAVFILMHFAHDPRCHQVLLDQAVPDYCSELQAGKLEFPKKYATVLLGFFADSEAAPRPARTVFFPTPARGSTPAFTAARGGAVPEFK